MVSIHHYPKGHWGLARTDGSRRRDTAGNNARAYIDGKDFKDTGCELHPSCLDCPRQPCIEDEPTSPTPWQRGRRNGLVMQMRANGVAVKNIAIYFGVNERTVRRIVEAKRKGRTK